jgi:threonine/homoserine/homoserine lactone efflux protein
MCPVIPIWAFIAVTVPLVLTPGASTAVVLKNSIAGGMRAGVQTAIGINAGTFVYGLLTAFGVALLLQQWPSLWGALRAGGTLYLAWLGLGSIRHALGTHSADPRFTAGTQQAALSPARARHLREGFVTNLLNPAIATFYFVIVPQFVPRDVPAARSVLVLCAIHIAIALSWHVVWAAAGGTLARTLASGRPRRVLDLVAGVALLALSVRLALG